MTHAEGVVLATKILARECNHYVNGRCDTRACMAKISDDPRKIEMPPRFVGCENYRAIEAMKS